jgi:hypothetical protein
MVPVLRMDCGTDIKTKYGTGIKTKIRYRYQNKITVPVLKQKYVTGIKTKNYGTSITS